MKLILQSGLAAVVVSIALTICVLGCGSQDVQRLHVSGWATHQGEPIPKGRIDFRPDRSRGNQGPAGYAVIDQGHFDTQKSGRGAVPGPQVVQIQGFDGKPGSVPGMLNGNPLFQTHELRTEIQSDKLEYEFNVP